MYMSQWKVSNRTKFKRFRKSGGRKRKTRRNRKRKTRRKIRKLRRKKGGNICKKYEEKECKKQQEKGCKWTRKQVGRFTVSKCDQFTVSKCDQIELKKKKIDVIKKIGKRLPKYRDFIKGTSPRASATIKGKLEDLPSAKWKKQTEEVAKEWDDLGKKTKIFDDKGYVII